MDLAEIRVAGHNWDFKISGIDVVNDVVRESIAGVRKIDRNLFAADIFQKSAAVVFQAEIRRVTSAEPVFTVMSQGYIKRLADLRGQLVKKQESIFK